MVERAAKCCSLSAPQRMLLSQRFSRTHCEKCSKLQKHRQPSRQTSVSFFSLFPKVQTIAKNLLVPDFDLKDDFESLALLIDKCDIVFGPFTAPSIQAAAQGTETIIFNLKSGDRWSFGNSLHYTEYKDEWYPNCHHFVFNQQTKGDLSNRIESLIDKTYEQKMKK